MKNINNLTIFILSFLLFMISCQPNPYSQGRDIYRFHCENCHMEDGSGLSGLIPSFDRSPIIIAKSAKELVCVIRTGLVKNPETRQEMPGNTLLNDVEITNLVNYLRNQYSTSLPPVKVADVRIWIEECP